VVGIRAKSSLPGESMEFELRGQLIINASGPWLDRLMKKFSPTTPERLRTTKGVHLAFPPLNRHAMALFSAVDGRLVFAIPWLGYSWIGTTDTDFAGDASGARATREDADYLVRSLQPYLPRLESSPIYFSNAGVRSLVKEKGSESSVSRMHRIVDEEENGLPGLISVLGGKITGYRAIAQEVTDLAGKKLRIRSACQTAQQPLPGAAAFTSGSRSADSISAETWAHCQSLYGTRSGLLLKLVRENEELLRPLHPAYPDLAAQVILAVREESCQRVSDFLLRRTRLGFSPDLGIQAIPAIAEWMGRELGWSEARRSAEIEVCHEELSRARL
jgi:glycerol-3-phosphate dehydrogenase